MGAGNAGGRALERLSITVGPHRYDALAAGPVDGGLVLLLHGWPEFADAWTGELRALGAAGYRAVAVDQRGYSPAARPVGAEHYTMDCLVADALGFADALGAARFHLVGHDWGGMVAWALAAAHPGRLRTLSVLATPHPAALRDAAARDRDQRRRLDYVRRFREPDRPAEVPLLADGAARLRAVYGGRLPAELVERNVARLSEPGALTATLNWYRGAMGDAFDIPGLPTGRITVPTLYLWGSDDAALGRVAAESTVDFVDADYRFEILEGVSHWIPEEVPETVVPLLLSHLGGARPSRGAEF
jgi:pimeloyl-ACP methyl ester carboxylesterase